MIARGSDLFAWKADRTSLSIIQLYRGKGSRASRKAKAAIERARQLADTGQYAQAIAVWRQLLDESPNDANVYNTIGDLSVKSRVNAEAIDAYNKAARFFLQEGFHLKAIAVYKKILKLEPARGEIYTLLGDLNVVRGLMNNAIADYLSSAKLFLKS